MELLGQNKVDHRQRKVAIISQDSFYKVLTPEQKAKALKGQYNFDHPGEHWSQTGLDFKMVVYVIFDYNEIKKISICFFSHCPLFVHNPLQRPLTMI